MSRDVAKKARGQITLFNKTDNPHTIPLPKSVDSPAHLGEHDEALIDIDVWYDRISPPKTAND